MKRPSLPNFANFALAATLALAAGYGCYTGPDSVPTAIPVADKPSKPSAAPTAEGMPCDVGALLQKYCTSCHGDPPVGAKSSLVTREALMASWDGGDSLAALSLARMRDVENPMPPSGNLSENEIAIFEQWVNEGMPAGSCDSPNATDPVPIELTCTSGKYWTKGEDHGDKLMTPGRACINCHSGVGSGKTMDDDDDDEHEHDDAPLFTFAGTVYPTAHEPDDCYGVDGKTTGTTVILHGADGESLTLAVNASGNFFTELPLALPYTAEVVRDGKSRTMKTEATDGDCNTCHGARSGEANGRITAP
ncbi:hypothetical protein AKJ09_09674 [Labilithrix luteola]|uniref:Cytochrome c domain-containing protein n=1 Tax=Labilithrix luteola TaxID=1391654 RepID=A0A0K1QB46_9BACT|nr:hypothetical protein [Labilithrix luteola]AKV03011.1 hypothetical protein AKJ09_09674 [Labilithrix luteola]